MHEYWIPAHVRVCPLLASTILLDLKRNRYFGIGTHETRALSTLALNWNEASGAGSEVEPLAPDAAPANEHAGGGRGRGGGPLSPRRCDREGRRPHQSCLAQSRCPRRSLDLLR